MPVPFSRTLRAQQADQSPRSLVVAVIALGLLGAWLVWFFRAKVSVYETSERARIEVGGNAYSVDSAIAGQIQSLDLTLGRRVEAGEVLVHLYTTVIDQQLAEAKARQAALKPRLDARRAEIVAEESRRAHGEAEATKAVERARANLGQAEAAAGLADEELRRSERLVKTGAVSEIEFVRMKADAAQKRASVESAKLEIVRLDRQRESQSSEVAVRISRLRSEISDLEGQVDASAAAVAALTEQVATFSMKAPVAGRIAEAVPKRVGAYVQAGERLAMIVPDGTLHAVADFTPGAAVGRIRVGQSARLRLEGYPWMQYGAVPARVDRVGTEAREGVVRVELTVLARGDSPIPMQHGLTGQMEVAVEEVTPYELTLRATGRALTTGRP